MPERIEFDEARSVEELVSALRWYWDEFVAAHSDDEIYGFGFYDSLQHGHIDVLVFTEADLTQCVEQYRYDRAIARWSGGDAVARYTRPDGSTDRIERATGLSDEEYLRLVGRTEGCFGFPAVLGQAEIDDAWNRIVVDDHHDLWDEPWADYERRARACCERALMRVDADGVFGQRRAGLTLLVTGEDESGVVASVARLNPPETAARFASEFAIRQEWERRADIHNPFT